LTNVFATISSDESSATAENDMIARIGNIGVVTLALMLAACGSDADLASTTSTTSATSTPDGIEIATSVASTMAPSASTEPTEQEAEFPTATFASISEDPVTDELAAKFQVALEELAARDEFAEAGGLVATVMTADGTWSGTTGTADGVRDLRVDDQFAIASITKSVIAAQVLSMVEAGELGLDDLAANHLPPDLQFDIDGVTIRHLLSHRSGLPDYYDLLYENQRTEWQRVWTPAEILEVLPTARTPPGDTFSYAETNYLLLALVIEQLRGRPTAEVLRDGVLAIDGSERLIHQPAERPSEPIAMPAGESAAALQIRGGYVPSLASVTAFSGSGAMASDAPSLARWWRAFCAGEIVSQSTLTEMATFDQEVSSLDGAYGLGLFNPVDGYAWALGHQGELFGYMSWAACLPEEQAVTVVLTNRPVRSMTVDLYYGALRPFIDVLRAG
jgi:D-alanyl-D-alanine carboxypeptidase